MSKLVLLNENSIAKISGFPVDHGITTNKFGDCSFSQKDNNVSERQQNLRLMKLTDASCFFKIVVEHSDRIKEAKPTGKIFNYLKCDAIVCCRPLKNQKPILISNTADCPIIFLTDKDRNFIAIIHSGWRGTARNISGKTIEKIKNCFNAELKNVQAGIWGGICDSCYKVGGDLKKYFPGKITNGYLNLRKIIAKQLLNSGISPENIFLPNNHCSAHSFDANGFLFASHRRKDKKRNTAFITFNYF